ncbi:hypothetical protein CEXT_117411 [Caerostris extrusa]|uniref:Uncharacterized protein n=1 Tax=Caerostris extrusa TaxID=172846 RepID=A0AAV4P6R8_CAEEX|nr:hypothetical protein CEXT_117411 [Caerostris extrusa]
MQKRGLLSSDSGLPEMVQIRAISLQSEKDSSRFVSAYIFMQINSEMKWAGRNMNRSRNGKKPITKTVGRKEIISQFLLFRRQETNFLAKVFFRPTQLGTSLKKENK